MSSELKQWSTPGMSTHLVVEIDGKGMLLFFIIKLSGEGIHNSTTLKLWQLIE